jgi:magnesium-dependent phosphatase-1
MRHAEVDEAHRGMFPYKLFVFDLDETLWTVSEGLVSLVVGPFHRPKPDRVENDHGFWVELKPGVRQLFDFLKAEKAYISIASRNDVGPTLSLLDAFEISPYLVIPQLCWKPKDESIRKIIKEIHKRDKVTIKPQEVFFLDDWPENVVPVRVWGATALLYGQDVASYEELLGMLR